MKRTIMVDPQRLLNTSGRLQEKVNEYRQLYGKLYTEVERLSTAWQGKDNRAFTDQINGFREDFDTMAAIMTEYETFLKNSHTQYTQTQQNRATAARSLQN